MNARGRFWYGTSLVYALAFGAGAAAGGLGVLASVLAGVCFGGFVLLLGGLLCAAHDGDENG